MKEYTTPEMIQAIMDNPELQFKNQRCGTSVGLINGDLVWIRNKGNEKYTIHHDPTHPYAKGNITDKWTLIQKPVDFITAANSGKDIKLFEPEKYEFLNVSSSLKYYNNLSVTLDAVSAYNSVIIKRMINGKWLIED